MKTAKIIGTLFGLPILTVALLHLMGIKVTITEVQAALALYLVAVKEIG